MQTFNEKTIICLALVVYERVGTHYPSPMLTPVTEVDLLPTDKPVKQTELQFVRRDGAANHSSFPVQQ